MNTPSELFDFYGAYRSIYEAADRTKPRPTVLPRSRETNIGDQIQKGWNDPSMAELDWDRKPIQRPTNREAQKKRLEQVIGTQRRQDKESGLRKEEFDYVLDYLIDEGFTDSYESAIAIVESMSVEWLEDIIDEANRWEREQEKKLRQSEKERPSYNATKDIAMMKSRRRESDFSSGATHPTFKRDTPSTGPRTHSYSVSLGNQRKKAHKDERNVTKRRPGSTPEDRASEAIWRKHGMPLKPGRMETISKSTVQSEKNRLLRQGEKRRGLRTQAVRSLGKALGWAHIDDSNLN